MTAKDDDDIRDDAWEFLKQSITAAVEQQAQEERRAAELQRAERTAKGALACHELRNDLVHHLGATLLVALEAACGLTLQTEESPSDPGRVHAVALFSYYSKTFKLWHSYNRATERSSWFLCQQLQPTGWGALVDDDGWRDEVFAQQLLLFLATQRP